MEKVKNFLDIRPGLLTDDELSLYSEHVISKEELNEQIKSLKKENPHMSTDHARSIASMGKVVVAHDKAKKIVYDKTGQAHLGASYPDCKEMVQSGHYRWEKNNEAS